MQQYENTDKLLAIKFPHSHHLIRDLEDACAEIKQRGKGWGQIGINAQGLDTIGQIVVKFFDVQSRWLRKEPGQPKHKKTC